MLKKVVFLLLFLFSSFQLFCQKEIGVEIGNRLGVLVPHRPVMKHIPKENIIGFDASIFKTVSGKKNWHSIYNSPKIGLTFYYSNLGNKEILGNASGVTTWIEFPFINAKHHQLGLNLKLGLGRISKPFNKENNPDNIAISSFINCLAIGGLQYQYIWDKFSIGSRFELTHFSNAALMAPNLGINLFQNSIFISYKFSKNKLDINLSKSVDRGNEVKHLNYIYVIGFLGKKQISNHLGVNYNIHGGTFAYQYLFSLPVGLEFGVDIMKNSSDLQILADDNIIVDNVLKTGTYLGYVLTLEKLHFLVAMGYYIRDQFNLNDKFYHRIGMRYTLLNRLVFNCTLKSHWGNADYLEFGLGMRFGK